MSRGKIKIFLALLLVVLLAGTGWRLLLGPVDNPGRPVRVRVPEHSTGRQVAVLLREAGLIRSVDAFVLYARVYNLEQRLQAGYYVLSTGQSLPEIAGQLVRGSNTQVAITIPEGYTLAQIAALLQRQLGVAPAAFWQQVSRGEVSRPYLRDLPAGMRRLEGYLFPDTYLFSADMPPREMIAAMLQRFDQVNRELGLEQKAARRGLTLHQLVTVASLVEKEARLDSERPLIAGVIYNRLHRGMPLQVDATVLYALGRHKEKVYYKDLQVDSPYNTYRYKGLPPGPIAMPGRASLLAAAQPASTNYLYYVARPDGSHAFAADLATHERNRRLYQP
ncbi:MAG: endolytic transglycosylase MltG [Desulfurispora sp.]|uniref:endolytic transglycosylase MltG n=1 Tax=Desulfurispora sp. TaxID=3014275 RepID=UPI00404B74B3